MPIEIDGIELQDAPEDDLVEDYVRSVDVAESLEYYASRGMIHRCKRCQEFITDLPPSGVFEGDMCAECEQDTKVEKHFTEILPPIGARAQIDEKTINAHRTPTKDEEGIIWPS